MRKSYLMEARTPRRSAELNVMSLIAVRRAPLAINNAITAAVGGIDSRIVASSLQSCNFRVRADQLLVDRESHTKQGRNFPFSAQLGPEEKFLISRDKWLPMTDYGINVRSQMSVLSDAS